MEEDSAEESVKPTWKRVARYFGDWAIALAFTALGFWLISAWRTPELPDTAPSWQLETLDGDTVTLADYQGKTVVLNFWATWCKPCLMEIPEFVKFSENHPDIPVLGVAVDGTSSKLKRFQKKHGISYPILKADSQIQKEYQVSSLPMTVIIGPDGEVKDVHVGIMMAKQLEWATN